MERFASKIAGSILFGVAAIALGVSAPAQAASVTYQVTNFTASGGDPVFNVATDLTLNSLALTETFADRTSQTIALFDANNTMRTSLDTSTVFLNSAASMAPDPVHGELAGAMLTGSLSRTNLSILNTFGGTPVNASVLSSFAASLPGTGGALSTNFYATDAQSGAQYGLGTLTADGIGSFPAAVPEPSTFLMLFGGLSAVALYSRARRDSRKA